MWFWINDWWIGLDDRSSTRICATIRRPEEEIAWLLERVNAMNELTYEENRPFVLPMGTICSSYAHILRAKAKDIVRLLYRMDYGGKKIDPQLYDVVNLLSGYFFMLALYLNQLENGEEVPFVSRNYSI